MALMWSSDKLGPICRSARDTETVLKTIAGHDPLDATSQDKPFPTVSIRRPKLAVPKDAMAKTQPEIVKNFEASLAVLSEFCDVVRDVPLPKGDYTDVFTAVFNGECASAFRDLIESGRSRELQSPSDKLGGYAVYGSLAVDYVDGSRLRALLNEAVVRAMEPYDAIVHPTLSTVALPIDLPFDKAYPKYPGVLDMGSIGNLPGLPSINVPNGFGENHLPTGLALLGRAWDEMKLTQIAKAYQARTSFHLKHPELVTA